MLGKCEIMCILEMWMGQNKGVEFFISIMFWNISIITWVPSVTTPISDDTHILIVMLLPSIFEASIQVAITYT